MPKTILITGASRGLGRALALEYASPGRTLLLHGRDAVTLTATQSACESRGATVVTLVFDLSNTNAWIEALGSMEMAKSVDLVIVNAGITNPLGSAGETWSDMDQVLITNLRAALATVSALLPHMLARGSGQIALISSLSAYVGVPATPTYSATKAALKNWGEAMRPWLAKKGIALSVVLPGFIETDLSARFPAPKPWMIDADDAAKRIARGLARNQARIAFPQPLAFGMWLLSTLPAALAERILGWLGFVPKDR